MDDGGPTPDERDRLVPRARNAGPCSLNRDIEGPARGTYEGSAG